VRFLTFNIWFSQHEMRRRMAAIGDIMLLKAPDMVALQEMTGEHWQICQEHPAFAQYTWSSPATRGYYTMIGSRVPFLSQPSRREFEVTRMGRDLLH
ncbi:unnamed protein product, partial [Polarella glacialis]